MLQKLIGNKFLWWAMIFTAVNIGAFFAFYAADFIEQKDTNTYISTARALIGDSDAVIYNQRILKPLAPLLMTPFSIIGIGRWGLFAQSIIFYFLAAFFIYKIVEFVYGNSRQAFYAVVLFVGAYPLLTSGLSFLTDMSGWFFYILSVWLTLLYLKKRDKKLILWNGFLVGVGMLFKENVGVAALFFGMILFLAKDIIWKEKLKNIGLFAGIFAIPVGLNSLIIYKLFNYSYWHWYKFNVGLTETSNFYTPGIILVNGAVTFGVAWLYFIRGALKEFMEKNWQRVKILVALLPSSLSFFLWPFPLTRMMYIAAPLLVLLGSYGLMFKNGKKAYYLAAILLVVYLGINYAIPTFNIPEVKEPLVNLLNNIGILTTSF